MKHQVVETVEVLPEERTDTRKLWVGLVDSAHLYSLWDRNPCFIFITGRFNIQGWGMCASVTLEQVLYFKCFVFGHLHTHQICLLCLQTAKYRQIVPPFAVFHYIQRVADVQTACVQGRGQLMKVRGQRLRHHWVLVPIHYHYIHNKKIIFILVLDT